jgi:hypothetical protein
MADTGDATNIANFQQLISIFTGMGAAYNPSNVNLKLAGLNAKLTAANAALDDLVTKRAAEDSAGADRETLFGSLRPRITQAVGYYASTGTDKNRIDDAKEFKRKIDGQRAKPVTPPDPNDPNAPKTISAAQTSYVQLVEHLDGLIEVFNTDSLYDPNETAIKTTTLTAYSTQLHAANAAVIDAANATAASRITRNNEIYHPDNGLVATARLAKEYIKALFGASSQEYKQVKGIPFRDRKV